MPTKVKGTTGVDKIEAGAVITNPSFSGNATVTGTLTVDSTASINGSNISTQPSFRNLIINGDMNIDQRNAGASVTADGNTVFPIDRFIAADNTDGDYTAQQSTDVPSGQGFVNSVKLTVSTTDTSLTTSQFARFYQVIEGLNIPHLMWGTSEAKTITVSFWVKASVTGTYDFSIQNDGNDRTYMTSYTINSANTWEKKTITIAGDTTGTWRTDNDRGIRVFWGLGTGPTYQTSTTGWQGANVLGSNTPNINFLATSGATWYLTGVQLEVGSGASDFEFLPYDVQLARCQRYYQLIDCASGWSYASTACQLEFGFRVPMRATPSVSATTCRITDIVASDYSTASPTISLQGASPTAARMNIGGFSGMGSRLVIYSQSGTNAAPIKFNAEL